MRYAASTEKCDRPTPDQKSSVFKLIICWQSYSLDTPTYLSANVECSNEQESLLVLFARPEQRNIRTRVDSFGNTTQFVLAYLKEFAIHGEVDSHNRSINELRAPVCPGSQSLVSNQHLLVFLLSFLYSFPLSSFLYIDPLVSIRHLHQGLHVFNRPLRLYHHITTEIVGYSRLSAKDIRSFFVLKPCPSCSYTERSGQILLYRIVAHVYFDFSSNSMHPFPSISFIYAVRHT